MKNSCKAVLLLIFLFALFTNAQESPQPLSHDSSLAVPPADSSSAIAFLPIAKAIEQEKAESKIVEEKNVSKNNPEDYQKNLRVMAYLHPLPLFFGAAYNMLMLSSTIEIPLSLSNSFIIQPTIWAGSSDGYIPVVIATNDDRVEYKKLKRVGSGVGMRRYVVEKGQGFYLQAIASAYYIHADSISHKKDEYEDDYWYSAPKITTWTKVKGVIGELMFYVGAAHKWKNISFSYEGGMGFGYDGTDTFQMGYINSLVTNFNLCIGIPF